MFDFIFGIFSTNTANKAVQTRRVRYTDNISQTPTQMLEMVDKATSTHDLAEPKNNGGRKRKPTDNNGKPLKRSKF